MKRLEKVILVQFSLFDSEEFELGQNSALLGANGAGKTTILDAIQVAMLGAHGGRVSFNTQKAGGPRARTLRDYCLGTTREGGEQGVLVRKRESAQSFITLVFRDTETAIPVSIGVNLAASAKEIDHEILGWYVLPGIALALGDHLEPGANAEEGFPLRWADFAAQMRKLSAKAGATPLFPPRPERYIDEMLHALQSRNKTIIPHDFINAFCKSLTLRGIESVNDFVRKFVVAPVSLNRERATAQIKEFNRLKEIVQRVREQIGELKVIDSQYEKVNREERRIATLAALGVSYQREHFERELQTQEGILDRETAAYVEHNDKVKALDAKIEEAEEGTERARNALANAPGASSYSHAEELLNEKEKRVKEARGYLEQELSKIARAVNTLLRANVLPPEFGALQPLDNQLGSAQAQLNQNKVEGLSNLLQQAVNVLGRCRVALNAALSGAQVDAAKALNDARSALTRYEQAKRGGAPLSPAPGLVIDILRNERIEATAVCDLVKVTATEWQPAIEAFLRNNRESLVVKPGRERDAVRVLRKQPGEANVHGVTIVQPTHLPTESWHDPEGKLVGSLFTGDPVAVGYLRLLFGRMRCVQTEEELEQHPRSMTKDGMLSANGGTRRMKLLAANELILGRRSTEEDVRRLQRESDAAAAAHSALADRVQRLEIVQAVVDKTAGVELDRLAYQINSIAQGSLEIDTQRQHMDALDSKDLKPLRGELDRCRKFANDLRNEQSAAREAHAQAQARASAADREIERLKPICAHGIAQEAAARASPDFDPEMEATLRERVDAVPAATQGGQQSLLDRARDCERRSISARNTKEKLREDAMRLLIEYLNKHNVVLGDERSDWKKAWQWARETLAMLEGSQLKEYAEKAEEARKAADLAFRTDISVRMREGVEHMRDALDQLNRQLKSCPPFSNGERYRFEAKPSEAHKSIYEYIMRSDADDLFDADAAANDEAHQRILQWLDLTGGGTKAENPLEDFRLLFTFDVLIEQDGVVVTKLSKRLGTGSGGEYKSPFYVIAGAALAAAYRFDPAARGSGMALMLLDEAFDGMDYQNTVATTRFLNSLGLQLVMAAPDTDLAKLAPVADTIYELMRAQFDVFKEKIEMKEAGRKLFLSDMPSEHPDLLKDAVAALAVTQPT